jgi:hypothetical protein
MTKPLNVLADELESEIDKIHKMNIDLPEELFIKSCMAQGIKKKYIDKYNEAVADSSDQDPDRGYDGKNPRDFFDLTLL